MQMPCLQRPECWCLLKSLFNCVGYLTMIAHRCKNILNIGFFQEDDCNSNGTEDVDLEQWENIIEPVLVSPALIPNQNEGDCKIPGLMEYQPSVLAEMELVTQSRKYRETAI
ncbi:unnamed protein product [Orchesella dallaii]|uniref:Uncharacterized protein n=1 Tax=Orchesella dallaii TaxID=48710 RepID=A0ABP1S870_9HEXA